jgi:S-adenosylmethionine-dependent methyltransferase
LSGSLTAAGIRAPLVFDLVVTDPRDLPDGDVPRGLSPLLWASVCAMVDEHTMSRGPVPSGEATRVLDCGGGSGSLAVPLASRGAEVTVVDVSIDALSTMLRRATEAGVRDRVTAVQAEAESMADVLPPTGFDVVLAHGVLENASNPGLALQQIGAVVRSAGVISILIANPVAGVLARALAGDVTGALTAFRRSAADAYGLDSLLAHCAEAELEVALVEGVGVFTDLVPGVQLERSGSLAALSELEAAAAELSPYRDIASRLHIVAHRGAARPELSPAAES